MAGGALKSRTKEFLCLLQEVSYLLHEAYKKAKLISEEDLKAWNMSMRPTLIHVSTPHPFSIIFPCHYASFLKTVFSTGSSVFLQETSCRTFGRAKSNFKSESNGGNLLITPTSTCVSIPCLHPSFFHLLVLLIVLLQELPVEIVGT